MIANNKIVHGLWVGNRLSSIELLTLHSFVNHGHEFHLWVYEDLENQLPAHVILQDANQIIPQEKVFRRKYNDPQLGIGKGSLGAPFSDIFRYKLLYEKGGWWVDMDVTCLKPLTFQDDYFFRSHPMLPMIGNIMKVPAKSELMKRVYEESVQTCDENTLEWLRTNEILNQHIQALSLNKYVFDDYVSPDWWQTIEPFVLSQASIPSNWHCIHWMNEEWRMRKMNKDRIYQRTTLAQLLKEYQIPASFYLFPPLIKGAIRKLWENIAKK